MRLTRAGEYAVRCVLYLSRHEKGMVISRGQIAEHMEIPDQFLSKIGQQLSRAGIIDIIQGAKGGFRMSVSPDELTLLAVIEAVIGEIYLNDCILHPDGCRRNPTCAIHLIWQNARKKLRETLAESTFARLVAEESCLSEVDI